MVWAVMVMVMVLVRVLVLDQGQLWMLLDYHLAMNKEKVLGHPSPVRWHHHAQCHHYCSTRNPLVSISR